MLAVKKRQPKPYLQVIQLNAENISNKMVTLDKVVVNPNLSEFLPDGGILQRFGIDYIISNNTLSWDSLGLDGFLIEGDRISLRYFAM